MESEYDQSLQTEGISNLQIDAFERQTAEFFDKEYQYDGHYHSVDLANPKLQSEENLDIQLQSKFNYTMSINDIEMLESKLS